MSLEDAIRDNTAAVRDLIHAIGTIRLASFGTSTGYAGKASANAKEAAAPKPEGSSAVKEEPANTPPTAAASAAPEQKAASSDAKPATQGGAVPYDKVKGMVQRVHREKGRETIMALLNSFGVDNAQKLTEAQWPDVVAACEKALA